MVSRRRATGPFDLFYLLQNPHPTQTATVKVTYLRLLGPPLEQIVEIAPASRRTIYVNADAAEGQLASDEFSASFESDIPASAGVAESGVRWGLAEGEVGGPRGAETYILVANVSNTPTDVIVRLLFEDGTPAMGRLFTNIPPNSRFNVAVQKEFGPEFIAEPFAVRDKRFSAIVESVGDSPAQLVVEQAIYWSAPRSAVDGRNQRDRDQAGVGINLSEYPCPLALRRLVGGACSFTSTRPPLRPVAVTVSVAVGASPELPTWSPREDHRFRHATMRRGDR